jgi:hypothetical protein
MDWDTPSKTGKTANVFSQLPYCAPSPKTTVNFSEQANAEKKSSKTIGLGHLSLTKAEIYT